MAVKKKNNRKPTRVRRRSPQLRTSPAFVTPMAAQVVKKLPEGDEWIYELKFDGYRALIIKDEQQVELRSRKNKDLTGMYRGIAAAGLRGDERRAGRARSPGAGHPPSLATIPSQARPSQTPMHWLEFHH